jgi:hypothetical protein
MSDEIVKWLSENKKWPSYEETSSIGSIKASSARSKRVEPSGLEKKRRRAGADQCGGAGAYGHTQSVGLADPGDRSIGQSPRVMNNLYIYMHTLKNTTNLLGSKLIY